MRRPETKPEEMRKGLEVIERNTYAQTALIEDVLDISRVIAGKLRLDLTPCDMEPIIRSAVDTVRAAADAKEIALDVEIDPMASGTVIDCDRSRMQQIVGNLLSNAVKFCPRGARSKSVAARKLECPDYGERHEAGDIPGDPALCV